MAIETKSTKPADATTPEPIAPQQAPQPSQQQTIQQPIITQQQQPAPQPQQPTIIPQPVNGGTQRMNQNNGQTMPQMAPKFTRLINLVGSGSTLSEKGVTYFETIRKALADSNNVLPVKISMLSTPSEVMALEHGGKVVFLAPTEALRDIMEEDVPRTIIMRDVWSTYTSTVSGTHQMLELMLVHPNDYDLVQNMIRAVKSFFISSSHHEFTNMTIEDLKSANLIVSTNSADIEKFMKSVYPHAVLPRTDMGFVLYQKNTKEQQDTYGQQKSYFDMSSAGQIPLACVTAFTEPVQIPGMTYHSNPKYLPVVNISSIVTPLPDNKLTSILLPLATDVFIRSGHWKNQFSNFSKDMPNIGKLIRDPATNAPWFAEHPAHRDQMFEQMFEKPSMVLNITEGTYRIPGLENYGIPEMSPAVKQMYADFLNAAFDPNTPISGFKYHEFIGTITNAGRTADSRWADYLNTIIHFESEANTVAQLLIRTADPKLRVNLIKRFYPSFEVLYSNIVAEINLAFMTQIQGLIRNYIHIAQNSILGGSQQLVDLTSMIESGRQFTSSPGFNYGSVGGVYDNPFGVVYHPNN